MKHLYALVVLTTLLLSAQFGYTQTWNKMNLPETGKHINGILESDDGVLYANTGQGLFKSTDDGANWTLANRSMSGRLLDVTADGKVVSYLTTQLVSASTDGTFELFNDLGFFIVNLTTEMVTANDGSLHLIYGESLQTSYYISTDNGATWVSQTYDEPVYFQGFNQAPILVNTFNGDLYYLGDNEILQRSTDNGATYSAVGSELSLWNLAEGICANPVNGHLYIQENVGNQPIVKKSTDNGNTWTAISTGDMYAQKIIAYGDEVIVYDGGNVFYTSDDGANWTNQTSLFDDLEIPDGFFFTSTGKLLSFHSDKGDQYSYAVAEVDFGNATVTNSSAGIDYTLAEGLSSNGSRIAASLSKWAHYTDDEGDTWTALKGPGAHSRHTYVANDGTVYAEKWDSNISLYDGIYVQNDQDEMDLVLDADGNYIQAMKFMFEDDQNNIYITGLNDFYRSSNGGPFTLIPGAPIDAINHKDMWYSAAEGLIYSINGSGGMHSSADQGETWTEGQGAGGFGQSPFQGEGNMWFFNTTATAGEQGYYTSTDLQIWTQQAVTINNLVGNGTHGLSDQTIITNTDDEVLLSDDAGLNWSTFETGLDSAIIYNWQGETWIHPTTELEKTPGRMLLSLAGGIYYWEYADIPDLISESNSSVNDLLLYPNPVRRGEPLRIDTEQTPDQVQVYDISGKLTLTVTNSSNIPTQDLTAGIYLIQIQSNNQQTTAKLIVD